MRLRTMYLGLGLLLIRSTGWIDITILSRESNTILRKAETGLTLAPAQAHDDSHSDPFSQLRYRA